MALNAEQEFEEWARTIRLPSLEENRDQRIWARHAFYGGWTARRKGAVEQLAAVLTPLAIIALLAFIAWMAAGGLR